MRLDIGPDGKIIGTRRVSPNGQVSGLSDFAGREVLVILPGQSSGESAPPWGSPESIAQVVEEQMRQAYQQYGLLQKLYATPWEATRSFVRSAFGGSMPDLAAAVDRWVQDQIRRATAAPPSPSRSSPAREEAASTEEPRPKGPGRSSKTDGSR